MLKKILPLFLVCCISAALLSSCAQFASNKREDSLAGEVAHESVDTVELAPPSKTAGEITVSISAPEGWTKKDDDSTVLWYEKGTAFLNVVEPWIPADAKTPMDVAKYEYLQIKGSFQEAEVTEPVETTIDGSGASRVDVSIAITAESSQKQVYVYFFRNGAAYQVTGVYFTENAQDSADVESMIQSIKLQ